ncbi:MAG: helix-turn-helix domain-containing protein [Acidobacteria bacterium]|nr:helix-turn-helix domain-containing protein [Acidobacteriota bacterium]
MTLGQYMKQRRAQLGKSAAECARDAGMISSEWWRWESSQSRRKDGKPSEPRQETVEAIARALDTTIAEIYEQTNFAGVEKLSDVPARWKRILQKVPADRQDKFMDSVEGIAELAAF